MFFPIKIEYFRAKNSRKLDFPPEHMHWSNVLAHPRSFHTTISYGGFFSLVA